jgi:acyl-coenzyme A thioesterase PaaI-like protein
MAKRVSRFTGTKFICDPSPAGFGIRFTVEDDQSVSAVVEFDDSKEGGRGILHGGAIAAVLDEAMGTAAFEQGSPGYTVTMTYNYKTHIPLYEAITVRARVSHIGGRKVFTECSAHLPDGTVAVDGTGIFIASDRLKRELDARPYDPET